MTRVFVATATLLVLSMTAHAQTRPEAPTLAVNGAIIIATWDEQPGNGYYVGVAERGRGNWRIANVITDPTDTEQSIQLYGASVLSGK